MKKVHTDFKKGTPLFIIKLNGDVVEAKYLEKKSKYIVTDKGKVLVKDIRSITIRKTRDEEV